MNNILALVSLLSFSWLSSASPTVLAQRMPADDMLGDVYHRELQAQVEMDTDGDFQGFCYTKSPFDPIRHKPVYKVGVLAIRGPDAAFAEYNKTFNEYLTATAGQRFDPPISFEMVSISFKTMFDQIAAGEADFVFVNPSAYSCLDSEFGTSSLATVVSKRNINGNVYKLQKFGGVIFTRANRNDISNIQDLKDKIIAAASISGLGSGQMQFKRMIDSGMNYLQDPKEIVFTRNQNKVVQGVVAGDFDVGFVRTDQLERSKDADGIPFDLESFKIIDAIQDLTIDGQPFPFESSTELYPEWNLAAFETVDAQVKREVQRAMLSIGDHALVGDAIAECLQNFNETLCNDMGMESIAEGDVQCDATPEIVALASQARQDGTFSEFVPTLSYLQLRSMQDATGFISVKPNTTSWQCVRSASIYDAITCPEGTFLKSEEEVMNGCSAEGLECDSEFQCLCRPCEEPEPVSSCENAVNIGGKCIPLGVILPSVIIPLVVLLSLCVYFYIHQKKKQNDAIWKVKPEELTFATPPKVIGSGTFGEVLLAEYRGTQVAVKRVIPERKRKTGKTSSLASKSSASAAASDVETGKIADNTNQKKSSSVTWGGSSDSSGSNSKVKGEGSLPIFKMKMNSRLGKTEFMEEMRHLSKLRHPCVTTVMGAVVQYNAEPLLVMEYMQHGSLYDLLHNNTIDLDGDMVVNMLQDISQGVRFLHCCDPQVIHGDLKAQNILVDDRFRAKVADFGFSHGRAKRQAGGTGTLYWMAPELLRGECQNNTKTDVYSFGMILYEVYSKRIPYDNEDPTEVLRLVADSAVRKRPPVPKDCPMAIKTLMKDCLHHEAGARPLFDEISSRLERIDRRELVKAKAAHNAFQGLPEHVAQQLRQGKKVQPETKQDVSIAVVQIVDLAALQSVDSRKAADAVSRLHEGLSKLAQDHGLFKLDTVGDTFMAAANLIGHQANHAQSIAAFCLDAISVANETFVDEQNPEHGSVGLKVGFATGTVVADVVGKQNPRYCLFGDAVSTAEGLSAHAARNEIYCTFESADILRKGNPAARKQLRSRGKVALKGKGKVHCFLLITGWHSVEAGNHRIGSFVQQYSDLQSTGTASISSKTESTQDEIDLMLCDELGGTEKMPTVIEK